MKRHVLGLLLFIVSQISNADIIGVEESQLLLVAMKQLSELRREYRLLVDTYQNAKSQLEQINQLKTMNSGHYGFGDLQNGLEALQSWQSPASTWSQALSHLSGGNPRRYQALIEAYEKNHPALNETYYASVATPQQVARFKEDKAVNRAVLVQTTEGYNELNRRMKRLYELSQHIEKTANTKAAVDLNSRLLTELGFIQLMSLRLQTLMNQQVAQESLTALQDRADMARFNHVINE